jgi:hypothetical protein
MLALPNLDDISRMNAIVNSLDLQQRALLVRCRGLALNSQVNSWRHFMLLPRKGDDGVALLAREVASRDHLLAAQITPLSQPSDVVQQEIDLSLRLLQDGAYNPAEHDGSMHQTIATICAQLPQREQQVAPRDNPIAAVKAVRSSTGNIPASKRLKLRTKQPR